MPGPATIRSCEPNTLWSVHYSAILSWLTGLDDSERFLPPEVIELLRSKTIDADLRKIVAPLEEGRVDTAEIAAVDDTSTQEVTVSREKRGYFAETETERMEEVTLIGRLISNNKETAADVLWPLDKAMDFDVIDARASVRHS